MKSAIAWLKSNPLTVIAIVVVLASVGAFVYFYGQSSQLRADLETQAKEPAKITRFIGQSVSLPPTRLGAAPDDRRITFNQINNERLRRIFADVTTQADATLNAITQVNQRGHVLLAEGFFPKQTLQADPYVFRDRYRDAMATLLGGPGPQEGFEEVTGIRLPTLNAGLPLRDDQLQQQLAIIAQEAQQSYGQNITEEDAKKVLEEQKLRLTTLLTDHAQTLHIYANPDIGRPGQLNAEFPLSVRPWIYAGTTPSDWQLWESQMELWVQQDIVEALRRANKIDEVISTDDDGNEVYGNVLHGVAKRLLRCEVVPGYVGLHVTGEVGTLNPGTDDGRGGRRNTGFTNNSRGNASVVGYPTPPSGAPTSEGAAVPANYFFGPTGRASNHVFDVRHVRLVLHADFEKLPDLYRAIASVNYMSVVDQRITGIDEFDFGSLGGPYLYGNGDIVQVELIVESLWLRSWIAPLMPEEVRTYTGVASAADAGAGPDADF